MTFDSSKKWSSTIGFDVTDLFNRSAEVQEVKSYSVTVKNKILFLYTNSVAEAIFISFFYL